MRISRAFALLLLVCSGAFAQNAAPLSLPKPQFFENNGYPLAGGLLFSWVAGSMCPRSPLATYTDATATVQNANPVILDAAGLANVWLGGSTYKLVLEDATE